MRRTRKSLAVVAFLILSSVSVFVVSLKALFPRSHHERRQSIPEEDPVQLRAISVNGHLHHRLIQDRHIGYRHKKIVKSNGSAVVKVPSPDPITEVKMDHDGGNRSRLLYAQSAESQSRALVRRSKGRESRDLTPMVEGNGLCILAPTSCLQADELGREEKERLSSCLAKAVSYIEHQRSTTGNGNIALSNCTCHLRDSGEDSRRVALISLPGSGNTWVRGLLEHATNICTGAMWCDPNLRATQFCGEGLHSARTLVVKNHDPTIRWRGEYLPKKRKLSENNKPEFDAAIFLHRNPYDAMVAEHNREVGYALWEAAVQGNHRLNLSGLSHHIQSFGSEYFGECGLSLTMTLCE